MTAISYMCPISEAVSLLPHDLTPLVRRHVDDYNLIYPFRPVRGHSERPGLGGEGMEAGTRLVFPGWSPGLPFGAELLFSPPSASTCDCALRKALAGPLGVVRALLRLLRDLFRVGEFKDLGVVQGRATSRQGRAMNCRTMREGGEPPRSIMPGAHRPAVPQVSDVDDLCCLPIVICWSDLNKVGCNSPSSHDDVRMSVVSRSPSPSCDARPPGTRRSIVRSE